MAAPLRAFPVPVKHHYRGGTPGLLRLLEIRAFFHSSPVVSARPTFGMIAFYGASAVFHFPMLWIAPSEKDTGTQTLEDRLWQAADQLRANSGLTSAQYSTPVLGLIFLRFADVRFAKVRAGLEKMASSRDAMISTNRIGVRANLGPKN